MCRSLYLIQYTLFQETKYPLDCHNFLRPLPELLREPSSTVRTRMCGGNIFRFTHSYVKNGYWFSFNRLIFLNFKVFMNIFAFSANSNSYIKVFQQMIELAIRSKQNRSLLKNLRLNKEVLTVHFPLDLPSLTTPGSANKIFPALTSRWIRPKLCK